MLTGGQERGAFKLIKNNYLLDLSQNLGRKKFFELIGEDSISFAQRGLFVRP